MTQITLVTAAILPISPLWQLRDSTLRPWPTTLKDWTCPIWGGDLTHIYEGPGLNSLMILATVTHNVSCLHQCSGGQGNTSWGFYLMCPQLGRKYQTARKYQGIYFMSGNETKGKYQTAHCYTETTETCIGPQGRPIPTYIYTYIYTHTRNLRIHVYTYIRTRFKAPHRRAAFMGFPCFWPTCSSTLCACSSSRQTNKQRNKHII